MARREFALALHTLILLARAPGNASSRMLAGSVNTHSSCLRRMMSSLSHAGLVDAVEGRDGGYRLAQPAESITLKDIYRAVACEPLLRTDPTVVSHCPISAAIGPTIGAIVADAEARFQDALERRTLADVADSVDSAAAWVN